MLLKICKLAKVEHAFFYILARNVEKMCPRMSAISPKASVIDSERRANYTMRWLLGMANFLIEDAVEDFVKTGFIGE